MTTAAARQPERHLTAVPDPEPADAMVELIAAHVAAATTPVRLARTPDARVMARVRAQSRLDAEGLPRMLYRIEDV